MKRILLLSCYELGHQPFPVAMASRFLRNAGFEPDMADLAVEPLPEETVRNADFIAISVPMHTALRIGVRAADRIRKLNPDCHINFFGLYAKLNADYLHGKYADSTLGGEFETKLVELVGSPRNGSHLSLDRQEFPLPFREGLSPLEKYAHFDDGKEHLPAGYVETTRGCKHLCEHCPIPPVYGGRFFALPKEIVLEDVRSQWNAGARHITFGDPDFLNGPTHALRIVRALHHEFPRLTFDATIKVEHVLKHHNLFPELKEAGCAFVTSAVESTSDTVLRILAKGHTRTDIPEALRIVREAGIHFRPTWVAFTPWTTRLDYGDMLRFLKEMDLVDHVDPVQLSLRLLVPPGSLLLENGKMTPHLTGLDPAAFSHRWIHPDPEMDRLQQDISRIVTEDARQEIDPAVTYGRIWQKAEGTDPDIRFDPKRKKPPRMTESWYC